MTSSNEKSGACLCGAITFSANLPSNIGACHCEICRGWSGGVHFFIEATNVKICGEPAIFSSSEWAERGFCITCGTQLFGRLKDKSRWFFSAFLFPDAEKMPIKIELFSDERPATVPAFSDATQISAEEFRKTFNE